jgi:CBS domain-containing protein
MKLYDMYSPLCVTAMGQETIADVSARMRFNDVGSAAVVDEHNVLVGIITERDVVRAVADGVAAEKTTVGEYMTSDPTVVDPRMDVREAGRIMLESGFRHLPVVTPEGNLIGLASIRDVVFDLIWSPRKL